MPAMAYFAPRWIAISFFIEVLLRRRSEDELFTTGAADEYFRLVYDTKRCHKRLLAGEDALHCGKMGIYRW